ncbi:MAG TPA: hypothetical protein VHU23_05270 [Rhizomicrobium sp.]|nr:hypothetical protein [Rhizomicrobium sp.]
MNPATGAETILHTFQKNGTDGVQPVGSVISPGHNGLELYGTTISGGNGSCQSTGCGIVFKINLSTSKETIIHVFGSKTNDGTQPGSDWTELDGRLYSTTQAGGAYGAGPDVAIASKPQFWSRQSLLHISALAALTLANSAPSPGRSPKAFSSKNFPPLPPEIYKQELCRLKNTSQYQFVGAGLPPEGK